MCARYEIDAGVIEETVSRSDTHNPGVFMLASGNVRPSNQSLVIAGHRGHLHAGIMRWGLPRFDGKGLVINTRSETALEKQMFREHTIQRRCVIPARAFYEWDQHKQMVTFSLPDQEIIWMAGIFDTEYRYSVLTTTANESVAKFHDRMPVLLGPSELEPWLVNSFATTSLMEKKMPELEHRQEYEQVSLF